MHVTHKMFHEDDVDVQEMIRFCFINLRGCNVGISNGDNYELCI
jgi:hypothetical protein